MQRCTTSTTRRKNKTTNVILLYYLFDIIIIILLILLLLVVLVVLVSKIPQRKQTFIIRLQPKKLTKTNHRSAKHTMIRNNNPKTRTKLSSSASSLSSSAASTSSTYFTNHHQQHQQQQQQSPRVANYYHNHHRYLYKPKLLQQLQQQPTKKTQQQQQLVRIFFTCIILVVACYCTILPILPIPSTIYYNYSSSQYDEGLSSSSSSIILHRVLECRTTKKIVVLSNNDTTTKAITSDVVPSKSQSMLSSTTRELDASNPKSDTTTTTTNNNSKENDSDEINRTMTKKKKKEMKTKIITSDTTTVTKISSNDFVGRKRHTGTTNRRRKDKKDTKLSTSNSITTTTTTAVGKDNEEEEETEDAALLARIQSNTNSDTTTTTTNDYHDAIEFIKKPNTHNNNNNNDGVEDKDHVRTKTKPATTINRQEETEDEEDVGVATEETNNDVVVDEDKEIATTEKAITANEDGEITNKEEVDEEETSDTEVVVDEEEEEEEGTTTNNNEEVGKNDEETTNAIEDNNQGIDEAVVGIESPNVKSIEDYYDETSKEEVEEEKETNTDKQQQEEEAEGDDENKAEEEVDGNANEVEEEQDQANETTTTTNEQNDVEEKEQEGEEDQDTNDTPNEDVVDKENNDNDEHNNNNKDTTTVDLAVAMKRAIREELGPESEMDTTDHYNTNTRKGKRDFLATNDALSSSSITTTSGITKLKRLPRKRRDRQKKQQQQEQQQQSQQLRNTGATANNNILNSVTATKVISTGTTQTESVLGYVPIKPYRACNDIIEKIVCTTTILFEADNIPDSIVPLYSSATKQNICRIVTSFLQTVTGIKGMNGKLILARIPVCIQTSTTVGVLVKQKQYKMFGSSSSSLNSNNNNNNNRQRIVNSYQLVRSINAEDSTADKDAVAVVQSILDVPDTARIIQLKRIDFTGFYKLGYYTAPNHYEQFRDDNYGNMVWRYASNKLLNPITTEIDPNDRLSLTNFTTPVDAMIIATANTLHLTQAKKLQDLMGTLTQRVIERNVPTIVIGIGIQKEFDANFMKAKAIRKIDLRQTKLKLTHPFQKEFLQTVAEHQDSPAIGVRGDLTRSVCMNSGIRNCVSIGCPSLTISRDYNLGQTLHFKWQNVLKQLTQSLGPNENIEDETTIITTTNNDNNNRVATEVSSRPLKIAVTCPASKLITSLGTIVTILETYGTDHVTIIAQTKSDRVMIDEFITMKWIELNPNTTIRDSSTIQYMEFWNVETWLLEASKFDLCISFRIHGSMTFLGSGVPTVAIPTDLRIMELIHAMNVPYLLPSRLQQILRTHLSQIIWNGDSYNRKVFLKLVLREAAKNTNFITFESNRRKKLKGWKHILDVANLEMDPTLLQIMNQ